MRVIYLYVGCRARRTDDELKNAAALSAGSGWMRIVTTTW